MNLDVLDGVRMPDGWTARRSNFAGGDYAKISALGDRARFHVTVDFKQRRFRGGLFMSGHAASTAAYTGRGWRQHLIQDAIAWLQAVMSS